MGLSIFNRRARKGGGDILYTPDVVADSQSGEKRTFVPDDILLDTKLTAAQGYLETGAPSFSAGKVPDPENFSQFSGKIRFAGKCIKMPGSFEHTIPASCAHLMGALKTIIDFEAAYSPYFEDKMGLLTVRQFRLGKGRRQNDVEWHRDRGGRLFDEEPAYEMTDHIYIASDVSPARVQMRAMTDAFNRLADGQAGEGVDYRQADPYEIILMSNYCLHAPGRMEKKGVRTFVQLIYTGASDEDMQKYTPEKPHI